MFGSDRDSGVSVLSILKFFPKLRYERFLFLQFLLQRMYACLSFSQFILLLVRFAFYICPDSAEQAFQPRLTRRGLFCLQACLSRFRQTVRFCPAVCTEQRPLPQLAATCYTFSFAFHAAL